jgi:hypothetical protein
MPILSQNDAFKIDALSPALARAAKEGLSPQDCDKFSRIFELAAVSGALRELDFVRDPDSSYNPWPARIAQICIEEGKLVDLPDLTVAVISCCGLSSNQEQISQLLDSNTVKTARLTNKIIEDLEPVVDNLSAAVSTVVKVHLLDRARQLHRSSAQRRLDIIDPLCINVEKTLKMYPSIDSITSKLLFWFEQRAPLLR